MRTLFVLMLYLALKASASQIQGHGDTSGTYGSEAHYGCIVDDPKDVLQVTWQRHKEHGPIENLATYNKHYGEQVNSPYQGKIVFTKVSLNSTSITVRNLTWADESCYMCLFNAYPGGSVTHQTCLQVQGVSQVKTQTYESSDDPEDKNKQVIFSCAATGKPRPVIQWEHHFKTLHVRVLDESKTSVLMNEDHTFTSSRNITLQSSADWDGRVDCLINSGMKGEARKTFTFTTNNEKTEKANTIPTTIIIIIIVVVLAVAIVLLVIFVKFLFWRKKSKTPTRGETTIL